MLYMCMSANIIPSGKSILLLGIFMPFGAVKGGQSHENNQYWSRCLIGSYLNLAA